MARIAEAVDTLRAMEPEEPWQMVHGDAHRVNVALDGGEAVWFDFEDANRRPLAWDLATLRRAWPAAGDEACRGLDVDADGFAMAWHHEFREVYALLWNLLYAQRDHRTQAATTERLEGWLARDELAAKGLTGADGGQWIYQMPAGGPLRYSWWHRKIWIPARTAVGRPQLGFHDLRRIYASQLVEAGVDVKVSQELMGHEDITLTRGLYAQAGDAIKQRANEAVAERLRGQRPRDERATDDGSGGS